MNIFQKKLQQLLEAEEPELPALDSGQDEEAFADSLDDGVSPDSVDNTPDNPINALKQQEYGGTISVISNWIESVDSWIGTLNGLDEMSMNSQLHRSDCNSIMADIRRSEAKRIARLAQELSALSESLKQYMQAAKQKQNSNEEI